jgi:hypothetical protein
VAGADLAPGLTGIALGEALGLPWRGIGPRQIKRRALLDGVGPTGAATASALAAARREDRPPTAAGAAGALPVALVAGWREEDPARRRDVALPLGLGAVVVADLGAWAQAGRPLHHLVDDHAKDWVPPFRGVDDEQRAVVDAVMATLLRHDDPTEGMRAAVRLGGGGIAVLTAVVGGILGCRRPTALARVPWRDRVDLDGLGLGG